MRLRTACLALALTTASFAVPASAAEFSADQKSEIESIVRGYLLENPEILEEAFTALQERRRQAESVAQQDAVSDNKEALFNSPRQVVLGNPEGEVTLVEFFDYNCGYCRRAGEDLNKLIEANPDLRVVLKEFPVLGPESVEAAQVGIAVNEVAPDRYGEFHDALLASDGRVDAQAALAVVEQLGLDRSAVETAMDADVVQATIEEVYTLANALGLTGTPSYVVGDTVFVGAVGYDTLQGRVTELQ
ncbi:DsbA family protein [Amorphus coralli]|uniref:DsbA family protein n=1 Tax=Amorphus coralli TaxID=340680 RepID=UPI000365D26F|nr:DsbA family protein [Amorphus coralli]